MSDDKAREEPTREEFLAQERRIQELQDALDEAKRQHEEELSRQRQTPASAPPGPSHPLTASAPHEQQQQQPGEGMFAGNAFYGAMGAEGFHQVAAAAVKLTPFKANLVEAWFTAIEEMFADCRITREETKYRKVMQALPLETIDKLNAFLKTNPLLSANPYTRIKAELLDRYRKTTTEQLNELFDSLVLGDQKPSDLLSEMMRKAGVNVSSAFLEPIWLRALPDYVSAVVSALDVPLEQKGKAADRILDKVAFRGNTTAAVDTRGQAPATTSAPLVTAEMTVNCQIKQLGDMMTALAATMQTMQSMQVAQIQRSRSRERGRHHGRQRSQTVNRPRENPDVCYFHERFGERAYKCQGDCKFASTIAPKN